VLDRLGAAVATGRGLGPAGCAGAALLAALALAAVLAPVLAPYDPSATSGRPFSPPSAAHWLGTNDVGHDLLSELLWGGRVSLAVGAVAALAAVTLGTTVGATAGYFRGPADAALMRLVDVVLTVPFLPLMVVLGAYLGPGAATLALVIAALVWARPARVVRAAVLGGATREYVVAARALGAGDAYLLRRHVLPGVLPLVLAELVQLASRVILLEASLAFLGLGDPLRKSWGAVLFYAQARGAFLSGAWVWWVLPPGLLITATVFALALLGLGLERATTPRLRPRRG
jgi:peptide/nickel transport system ATP-binding protein/peptide/nickel transport system permease protein